MEQRDETLAGIVAHVEALKKETVSAMQLANSYSTRKGWGTVFNNVESFDTGAAMARIRADEFYGQASATAMREILKKRRAAGNGPASVNEVYDTLLAGGFAFETDDVENRKRNLRISLSKNTAVFHRLPDGNRYGLCEWYPDVKTQSDEPARKPKKGKKRRAAARAPQVAVPAVKALPEPPKKQVTMSAAVQAALENLLGDFTKQDVLDWIGKHHPSLDPEGRKVSVFTTIAKFRDTMNIKTVKKGTGTEPHVFRREAASSNGKESR